MRLGNKDMLHLKDVLRSQTLNVTKYHLKNKIVYQIPLWNEQVGKLLEMKYTPTDIFIAFSDPPNPLVESEQPLKANKNPYEIELH
jgi:hypothetical protein